MRIVVEAEEIHAAVLDLVESKVEGGKVLSIEFVRGKGPNIYANVDVHFPKETK